MTIIVSDIECRARESCNRPYLMSMKFSFVDINFLHAMHYGILSSIRARGFRLLYINTHCVCVINATLDIESVSKVQERKGKEYPKRHAYVPASHTCHLLMIISRLPGRFEIVYIYKNFILYERSNLKAKTKKLKKKQITN
jgi:hypothetical protein